MNPKRTRRAITASLGVAALASALILAIPAAVSATGPATVWTRQFGTSAFDFATAMAVDAKRNVYVAGCTKGTLPHGSSKGGQDAFVRKLRPNGSTAWTRQFGTSEDDCARAIGVDGRGRIVVAGETSGAFEGQSNQGGADAFLRTFRPDGRTVWTRQFGTSAFDSAKALAIDSRDRILVVGETNGTFGGQTNKGGFDAFLRTFGPDGRTIRTRQFGTSGPDSANAVAVDSRDRILVAGSTNGTFGGQTNKGGQDAFLRTFARGGRTIRTRQFGTSGTDQTFAIAVDSTDRVLAGGFTNGTFGGQTNKGSFDAFLRTFRRDGRTVRTRQFGTSGDDAAEAVTIDSRGRTLVAGETNGTFGGQTNKGSFDAFLRTFRRDGRTVRTRQFGTSGVDAAEAVTIDSRGRTLVAGETNGAFVGQTSKGGTDAFVRAYRH